MMLVTCDNARSHHTAHVSVLPGSTTLTGAALDGVHEVDLAVVPRRHSRDDDLPSRSSGCWREAWSVVTIENHP